MLINPRNDYTLELMAPTEIPLNIKNSVRNIFYNIGDRN